MTTEDYFSCYRRTNAGLIAHDAALIFNHLTAMQWAAEDRLYGEEYADDTERGNLEKLLNILDRTLDDLDDIHELA